MLLTDVASERMVISIKVTENGVCTEAVNNENSRGGITKRKKKNSNKKISDNEEKVTIHMETRQNNLNKRHNGSNIDTIAIQVNEKDISTENKKIDVLPKNCDIFELKKKGKVDNLQEYVQKLKDLAN